MSRAKGCTVCNEPIKARGLCAECLAMDEDSEAAVAQGEAESNVGWGCAVVVALALLLGWLM